MIVRSWELFRVELCRVELCRYELIFGPQGRISILAGPPVDLLGYQNRRPVTARIFSKIHYRRSQKVADAPQETCYKPGAGFARQPKHGDVVRDRKDRSASGWSPSFRYFRSSLIRQFSYAQILRGVQTFVLVTDRLEACPTKKDGQEFPSYMQY